MALDNNGNVWSWGRDDNGQLGDGATSDSLVPTKVNNSSGDGYLSDIISISCNYWNSMALDSSGNVWVWGGNTMFLPTKVDGLINITQISAGVNHFLAVDSAQNVWAWGDNSKGELGDGTTDPSSLPIKSVRRRWHRYGAR